VSEVKFMPKKPASGQLAATITDELAETGWKMEDGRSLQNKPEVDGL
jgi:hypothetical protein